jgi:hypothetical protein
MRIRRTNAHVTILRSAAWQTVRRRCPFKGGGIHELNMFTVDMTIIAVNDNTACSCCLGIRSDFG